MYELVMYKFTHMSTCTLINRLFGHRCYVLLRLLRLLVLKLNSLFMISLTFFCVDFAMKSTKIFSENALSE